MYRLRPAVISSLFDENGDGRVWCWRRSDLSTTEKMTVVIAICDEEKIERALSNLHKLLEAQIGVLKV